MHPAGQPWFDVPLVAMRIGIAVLCIGCVCGEGKNTRLHGSQLELCPLPKELFINTTLQLQLKAPGSSDRDTTDAWLAAMQQWRSACRDKLRLDGSTYDVPALRWTQTAYMQPLMMYTPFLRRCMPPLLCTPFEKLYRSLYAPHCCARHLRRCTSHCMPPIAVHAL